VNRRAVCGKDTMSDSTATRYVRLRKFERWTEMQGSRTDLSERNGTDEAILEGWNIKMFVAVPQIARMVLLPSTIGSTPLTQSFHFVSIGLRRPALKLSTALLRLFLSPNRQAG
jgi:hypothetical protein